MNKDMNKDVDWMENDQDQEEDAKEVYRPTSEELICTLEGVRDLLQGEARWIQGELARDQEGTSLEMDLDQKEWYAQEKKNTEACTPSCFCLVGAIMEVVRRKENRIALRRYCSQELVTTLLLKEPIQKREWQEVRSELQNLTLWNDHEGRTQEEVLGLIQETVDRLKNDLLQEG